MNKIRILLFVLIFSLFRNTESLVDLLLKNYNKYFAKFKSIPKPWTIYIERTIKEALINVKFTNYQDNNVDIISFVNIFLNMQQKERNKCDKDYLHCLPKLPDLPPSINEEIDVLQPAGSLCFDSLEKDIKSIVMGFHDPVPNILNTWIFNLDPSFLV